MKDRVLVSYASRCGSTGEVAEVIGQAIRETGTAVDVRPVKDVTDLSPYRAVIVGSAIRMGRWLPEAVQFVKMYQEALSHVPAAYFIVCLTMKDDTEDSRGKVMAYIDPVREQTPQVQPVDVGFFAGALDLSKLPFFYRLIMKLSRAGEGDFSDPDAIRAWAVNTLPALLDQQPSLDTDCGTNCV